MAGPVRWGSESAEAAVSGMDAMSSVMGGYMQGEQVNFERYVDQRNYNEGVRQFDLTFNEQVRQFDTSLDFTAWQNDLNRQHAIFMQDDQQEWTTEENQLQRDWQGEENDAFRAVDYYRIKKDVEMRNLDRGLQYRQFYNDHITMALGGYNSYDEIPDYSFRDVNGNLLHPGRDFDLITEVTNIAAGKGSTVIQLDPKTASQLASDYAAGKYTKETLAQAVMTGGASNVVVNMEKEAAVEQMMLQRVGNDINYYNSLPESEKYKLRQAVIHDMNNHVQQKKVLAKDSIEFYAQQRALDAGVMGQGQAASPESMDQFIAQQNGAYFYQGDVGGFPRYSGVGNSMAAINVTRAQVAAVSAAREGETITDPAKRDTYFQAQDKIIDTEIAGMIELGVPREQAEFYGSALKAVARNEWDPQMWSTFPKPKTPVVAAGPLGTADGATRSQMAPAPTKSDTIATRYGYLPRNTKGLDPNRAAAVNYAIAQEQYQAQQASYEEKKRAEMESLEVTGAAEEMQLRAEFRNKFPGAPQYMEDQYVRANSAVNYAIDNPQVSIPAAVVGMAIPAPPHIKATAAGVAATNAAAATEAYKTGKEWVGGGE